jgi:predicted AlkP superfamily phosphohydrolase/phosphomutase
MEHYQGKPTVFIVSDHGFAPIKKQLHLNNWLEQEHLLHVKAIYAPFLRLVRRLVPVILPDKRSNGGGKQKKLSILGLGTLNELAKKVLSPQNFVDFKRSKAYCPSITSQAIRIFAKNESERSELVNTLISALLSIKDPESGESVVVTAARWDEVYQGSATDEAPDILLVLKEGYIATNHYSYSGKFLHPPASITTTKTGDHRPEGVFVASGDGIKDTGEVSPLSVYDITPAILQLMDIPSPDYMDGELRQDVLTHDVINTEGRPIVSEKIQLKTRIRNLKGRGLKL